IVAAPELADDGDGPSAMGAVAADHLGDIFEDPQAELDGALRPSGALGQLAVGDHLGGGGLPRPEAIGEGEPDVVCEDAEVGGQGADLLGPRVPSGATSGDEEGGGAHGSPSSALSRWTSARVISTISMMPLPRHRGHSSTTAMPCSL